MTEEVRFIWRVASKGREIGLGSFIHLQDLRRTLEPFLNLLRNNFIFIVTYSLFLFQYYSIYRVPFYFHSSQPIITEHLTCITQSLAS